LPLKSANGASVNKSLDGIAGGIGNRSQADGIARKTSPGAMPRVVAPR